MVRFIIVRHGYSVANKEKRFAGQLDCPLDDVGLSQAQSIAEALAAYGRIDAIYSSDLSRAYQSVKPLAERLGLPIHINKNLREINVGKWQGQLIEDVRRQEPERFEAYRVNPGLFRFEEGESYGDAMVRGKRALDEIAAENEGKTVVIGTHGGIVRALRIVLNGLPPERLGELAHVGNASLTVLDYEQGQVVWHCIGYTEHLADRTTEEGIK